jgi:ParB-like chromosome segregation protein Spo0J
MNNSFCVRKIIDLKDILPNPFRNEKDYPYDRSRVETLKQSIETTGFWENIVARPSPTNKGKYEIAHGHHRIRALRELGYKQVQLPTRNDIDDSIMLKMMADENAEDYGERIEVLHETVRAVRTYLQKMLNEYEYLTLPTMGRVVFQNKHALDVTRGMGVGRDLVMKFLGRGYSKSSVETALAAIKAEEAGKYDVSAGEKMGSVAASNQFRRAVTSYNIPKEKQAKIAERIGKRKPSVKEVQREVRKEAKNMRTKTSKVERDPMVERLEKLVTSIDEKCSSLANKLSDANVLAEEIQVQQIDGLAKLFGSYSAIKLLRELEIYVGLFGYDVKGLMKEARGGSLNE